MRYLGILIASSLLASCANMPKPEKPKLEMGIIDAPSLEVITNKINMDKVSSVKQLTYSKLSANLKASKYVRVPIMDYDKAVALKPRPWEQLQNYLDKVEDYLKNHCN